MAKKWTPPPVGSGWRRIKSGHRYTVTATYWDPRGSVVELSPVPGEAARKTWLSEAGFKAKFEPGTDA